MDNMKLSQLPGVLGVRVAQPAAGSSDPTDVIEESVAPHMSESLAYALALGMQAVEQLGDCRLSYAGKDGVTVGGQTFNEARMTLVVAVRTGHPVVKSLRRLMRGVAKHSMPSTSKAAP